MFKSLSVGALLARTDIEVPGNSNGSITIPNPINGVNNLSTLLDKLINFLLVLAPIIVTLVVLLAAFKIIQGGSDPAARKEGKDMIFWAVIGYAIVLMAKGIALIIKNVLGAN